MPTTVTEIRGSMRNIEVDTELIFPNVQTCLAVVALCGTQLVGAHVTLGDRGRLAAVAAELTRRFGAPNAPTWSARSTAEATTCLRSRTSAESRTSAMWPGSSTFAHSSSLARSHSRAVRPAVEPGLPSRMRISSPDDVALCVEAVASGAQHHAQLGRGQLSQRANRKRQRADFPI